MCKGLGFCHPPLRKIRDWLKKKKRMPPYIRQNGRLISHKVLKKKLLAICARLDGNFFSMADVLAAPNESHSLVLVVGIVVGFVC